MSKRKISASPVQLITLGLLILLAILTLVLFAKIADNGTVYTNEYSEMVRILNKGDYPEVSDMARENAANGAETEQDTSEFGDFARYFEATMLYKAYQGAGDDAAAEKQHEIMKNSYQKFTDEDIIEAADSLR